MSEVRLVTPLNPELYSYLVSKYMLLCSFPEMDDIRTLKFQINKLKKKKSKEKLSKIYNKTLLIYEKYNDIYNDFKNEDLVDVTAHSLIKRYYQGIFADLQCRLYKMETMLNKK